tara:strand:- start:9666 stop:9902 length:237 start_codon:yes stop_codon:yes gene_type:complete
LYALPSFLFFFIFSFNLKLLEAIVLYDIISNLLAISEKLNPDSSLDNEMANSRGIFSSPLFAMQSILLLILNLLHTSF